MDKITTLVSSADPETKIYPNVKRENLPLEDIYVNYISLHDGHGELNRMNFVLIANEQISDISSLVMSMPNDTKIPASGVASQESDRIISVRLDGNSIIAEVVANDNYFEESYLLTELDENDFASVKVL